MLLSIEKRFHVALVAGSILFNLIFLSPEVLLPAPNLNDNVLHYALVARASEALSSKENIFDHWVSYWVMGFPVFHYYQHLPHIFVAVLHRAIRIDLFTFYNWIKYLLLSFSPLFIYFSLRKLEFPRTQAAFSALCSPLLSTNFLYGLEFGSFVWRGSGMYTQLWGMVLLPLCLGQVYSTMKHGGGYFKSVGLLAMLLLSHVVYAYMAVLSLLGFIVLKTNPVPYGRKMVRLIFIFTLSGIVGSYFLIPYLANTVYLNRSVWEAQEKYNSYGHEAVLEKLFTGDLLDFGRFPILTLLMFLGLVRALVQRREHHRLTLALFFMWILLYFGRPTWGILLDLLPLSANLHLHRFIGGVHLAAIFLIGIGLHTIWEALTSERKRAVPALRRSQASKSKGNRKDTPTSPLIRFVPAILLIVVTLLPVYRDRIRFLNYNAFLMKRTHEAFKRETKNINGLTHFLRRLQNEAPGRVYAGGPTTWGSKTTVGDVPLYALLSADGIDTLGYLYHAMSLNSDIQVHFNEKDPVHYDLFNVRYVVAPAEKPFPEFVRRVKTIGSWSVYQAQTSGYFDLVQSDRVFRIQREDFYRATFRWLNSDLPKAKQHPSLFFQKGAKPYREWVEEEDFTPHGANGLPRRGSQIASERAENQIYSASVVIEKPCYLLFKMTYHPYWHAVADGVEKELMMLSPSFIGLRMDPGVHRVRFQYRPPFYKSLLLLLGLVTLAGVYLFEKNGRTMLNAAHTMTGKRLVSKPIAHRSA